MNRAKPTDTLPPAPGHQTATADDKRPVWTAPVLREADIVTETQASLSSLGDESGGLS